MDDDKLARIHEWLGAAMSPPSDAIEAQIRRKLLDTDMDVEIIESRGFFEVRDDFGGRGTGPTIYDAVLEYLRVANNG